MAEEDRIEAGRRASAAMRWAEAYRHFLSEDSVSQLDPGDLQMLGDAAYLIARDEEAVKYWTQAHNGFVDTAEIGRAARVGFLLSLTSLLRGELSQSNGWLARVRRLLETDADCPAEDALANLLSAIRQMFVGDPAAALPEFETAVALGTAVKDADLLALALLCRGQALVEIGQVAEGAASLDEAMVWVTSGQVSPILSGIIYCAVILTCQSVFDSERAWEWTETFDSWCRAQPDLVPYRGQCLIHRSEILQMTGHWPEAMTAAARACQWLADKTEETVGRAQYQKGEMHRLMGEDDAAEACYDRAVQQGVNPLPGRALLRLGTGQADAAASAIRAACGTFDRGSDGRGHPERLRLLGPSVDICLSVGETETAEAAAGELARWAAAFNAPLLQATSAQASGAVLAARGRNKAALAELTEALTLWQRLSMPYDAARTRAQLAAIHDALGNAELARMHRAAAGETFRNLGAIRDLSAVTSVSPGTQAGLTGRQIEVLRLMADGLTNRQVAKALGLSEHTVARHMSNIFDKTGVSSRTAAVDFAHRTGLLR